MYKKLLYLLPIFCASVAMGQYEAQFQSRKDVLYNLIMEKYYCNPTGEGFQPCNSRPPGYFNIGTGDPFQRMAPKMLVVYEREGISGTANSDLANSRMANHLTGFSLFHFNIPGVTKLLMAYPNAPSHLSTKKLWLKDLFTRNDSYNAFTGEGTENHLFMSRLPAYVLCELAIDSFPVDTFPQAPAMRDSLKNYIMTVSKKIYSAGIGEFNSATYISFAAEGWLVLFDHAKDPEVKAAARAVLDYFALETALHYNQGLAAGSDMRGNGKHASLTVNNGLAWLAWLWYGDAPRDPFTVAANYNNGEFAQAVYAAASSYRPPVAAVKLAQKTLTKPAMYYNSKGSYLSDNPSYIKQTLYVDKDYSIGAAYFPYGGWAAGDWQIQSWKMISRVDSGANKSAQYISGQGMQYFKGGHYRTPFDQLAHHKNVLIQLTRVPANAATIKSAIQSMFNTWATNWDSDFGQRFSLSDTKITSVNGGISVSGRKSPIGFQNPNVSLGDSYMDIIDNGGTYNNNAGDSIFFVELEKTYLAIRTIKNNTPAHASGKLTDASAIGSMSGFVLEIRNKSEFASFAAFQTDMLANTALDKSKAESEKRIIYTSSLGDTINVQYQSAGTFTEPIFDWGYGVTTRKVIHSEPPFVQPTWPTGEGHGKIATWTVNGQTVDLSQPWGVYEGPHAVLKNHMLTFDDSAGNVYTVDYTGQVPVFGPVTSMPEAEATLLHNDVKIYPNPTNGTLNVAFDNAEAYVKVSVYNVAGKLMGEHAASNTSHLSFEMQTESGIYILKIKTGTATYTRRVILK